MSKDDVPVVVRIHIESFPGFFLSFLGPGFLRLFYAETLRDEAGIGIVATDEAGHPVAFVAGVTGQTGFFRRLLRGAKWRFALAACGALVRRPTIAGRLLRALRRPKDAATSSAEACLMSVAVSPAAQGRGLGRDLVTAFGAEVRRRGSRSYCLTTDAVKNDTVNAFYGSQGFALVRTFVTPEGRPMNEYLMRLE